MKNINHIKYNIKRIKSDLGHKRNKIGTKFTLNLDLQKVDWEKVENVFARDRNLTLNKWKGDKDKYPSTRDVLKFLAGGAVIALSLSMPTLPMAVAPFILDSNKYGRSKMKNTLQSLHKQRLVEYLYKDGYTIVRITDRGKTRALRYKIDDVRIKKPKVWDKKWRLVIFDIPEKYKGMREIFRKQLQIMGFYMLQKSVWVHPYRCFDEIEFLRSVYDVGINVTYIVAHSIENADYLKSHFELK